MGTEVSLDIAGLGVDRSKSGCGVDHGFLFQSDGRWYVGWVEGDHDDEPDRTQMAMTFTRPLRTVLSRFELLGYPLAAVKVDCERAAAD